MTPHEQQVAMVAASLLKLPKQPAKGGKAMNVPGTPNAQKSTPARDCAGGEVESDSPTVIPGTSRPRLHLDEVAA